MKGARKSARNNGIWQIEISSDSESIAYEEQADQVKLIPGKYS